MMNTSREREGATSPPPSSSCPTRHNHHHRHHNPPSQNSRDQSHHPHNHLSYNTSNNNSSSKVIHPRQEQEQQASSSSSSNKKKHQATSGKTSSKSLLHGQPSHQYHQLGEFVGEGGGDSCCSSSISSTSSGTTVTTTSSSSSSSSSSSCEDFPPPKDHRRIDRCRSATGNPNLPEATLNDLNAGSPSFQRRMTKKASPSIHDSDTTSVNTRNSTPSISTENCWSAFHNFTPSDDHHHTMMMLPTFAPHQPGRSSATPRVPEDTMSEHYATFSSSTLEQRLKTATLGSSSSSPSKGKAVAVIKGTASVSRLSSSSFNNGSNSGRMSGSDNRTGHCDSTSDWKKQLHSHEIKKLRRELEQSNEKVSSLTSQLATHSHMVTAFEQSLASMSLRLQQLQTLSNQKDGEISRLKVKIEELKVVDDPHHKLQSVVKSSKSSCSSASSKSNKCGSHKSEREDDSTSTTSKDLSKDKKKLLIRRHTFVSPLQSNETSSHDRHNHPSSTNKEGRWFSRAFRRSGREGKKSSSSVSSTSGSASDHEGSCRGYYNDAVNYGSERSSSAAGGMMTSSRTPSMESISRCDSTIVQELKKQLREKEKIITDLRLESLSSAHQLQSLEELVSQLRGEVSVLRAENDRLQHQHMRYEMSCGHHRHHQQEQNFLTSTSVTSCCSPTTTGRTNDSRQDSFEGGGSDSGVDVPKGGSAGCPDFC